MLKINRPLWLWLLSIALSAIGDSRLSAAPAEKPTTGRRSMIPTLIAALVLAASGVAIAIWWWK